MTCLEATITENLSQVNNTIGAGKSATVNEVYETHEESITERIGKAVWKNLPSIKEDFSLLGDKEDTCFRLIDAYIKEAFKVGFSYGKKGDN
jgi:predicted nuclease with RNAse H fold